MRMYSWASQFVFCLQYVIYTKYFSMEHEGLDIYIMNILLVYHNLLNIFPTELPQIFNQNYFTLEMGAYYFPCSHS